MMVKVVKSMLGSVVSRVSSLLAKGFGGAKPTLITAETNPELIKAVQEDLNKHDASMLAARLLEMEKAIYFLAGRVKESNEEQRETREMVVAVGTTLEEMVHGMEDAYSAASEESDDDEVLEDAWEGKKGSTLN